MHVPTRHHSNKLNTSVSCRTKSTGMESVTWRRTGPLVHNNVIKSNVTRVAGAFPCLKVNLETKPPWLVPECWKLFGSYHEHFNPFATCRLGQDAACKRERGSKRECVIMRERQRKRERDGERERILHKDKDLSTSRFFYKSVPDMTNTATLNMSNKNTNNWERMGG